MSCRLYFVKGLSIWLTTHNVVEFFLPFLYFFPPISIPFFFFFFLLLGMIAVSTETHGSVLLARHD